MMRAGVLALVLIVGALTLAGCGDDEADSSQTTTAAEATTTEPAETAPPAEAAPADPLSCLEEAGLEDAEQRDANLWRGTDPDDASLVIVDRMELAAAAARAVREADLVWSASAGRYFVHGASRESGDGEKVDEVADCLQS